MSEMTNMPTVSVGNLINEYTALCSAVIASGKSFSKLPAWFLWGPPGVGKSDAIKQIAKNLEEDTGKRVVITDIRLLLFSPIDLHGVPIADERKEFTKWLMPKFFDMDSSDETINILFLDELSAAPPSIQATAYQITLDRAIGEHKLPDNCLVIAAGNRTTDRSVAYKMPNALANRLIHFEVGVDFESWKDWASKSGIHPFVLGYLAYDNSKLYAEDVPMEQVAFPTPRSWAFVSELLNTLGDLKRMDELFTMISGCVGSSVALEFISWCNAHADCPEVMDIFKGVATKYPTTMDGLYALINSIVTCASQRANMADEESLSVTELENVCRYAMRFPMDYQMCLYTNLCAKKQVKELLVKVKSFRDWVKKNQCFELTAD